MSDIHLSELKIAKELEDEDIRRLSAIPRTKEIMDEIRSKPVNTDKFFVVRYGSIRSGHQTKPETRPENGIVVSRRTLFTMNLDPNNPKDWK